MLNAARRVPKVIWWITALHLTLLLAYSILLPTYRAPDESEHVDLAHLFATQGRYPAWDEREVSPGVYRSRELVNAGSGSAHLTAATAIPRNERPTIDQLETPARATRVNQLPQHPPLYYVLAGGAEHVMEIGIHDPSFDLETWLYRLVSVLLVAPLPLLIWHIAKLLVLPAAVGIAATLVPLAIPQFTHIGSAVNNDSLMLVLFWLLTPLVIRLARGDLRPRMVVLTGLVSGLGLFTKGFALVMPLWVIAALLVGWRRQGRVELRGTAVAGGLYLATTVATGGWWWLRNLLLYRQVLPSRYYELVPDVPPVDPDLGRFVRVWAYLSTQLFWGNFGLVDVALPTLAFGLATAVCLVAMGRACWGSDRVAATLRGDRLLLAAPLLLLVATQCGLSLRAHLNSGFLIGMQGRYWFGALAGMAVVVALGLANLAPRALPLLPVGMLAAVAAMQATGISTILAHYWGPAGGSVAESVRGVVAWSPVAGELVAVGAVLGAVAACGTVAQVTTLAVRGRSFLR